MRFRSTPCALLHFRFGDSTDVFGLFDGIGQFLMKRFRQQQSEESRNDGCHTEQDQRKWWIVLALRKKSRIRLRMFQRSFSKLHSPEVESVEPTSLRSVQSSNRDSSLCCEDLSAIIRLWKCTHPRKHKWRHIFPEWIAIRRVSFD